MNQNTVVLIGIFSGLVPALVWLFFWLQEDAEHPKPKALLFKIFAVGMASVILIVPFEQIARDKYQGVSFMIVIWAALEEIIKLGVVYYLVLKSSRHINHPIDYPIYFITAALGFAAFENTLFLIHPLSVSGTSVGLLTVSLRFLGANLLHAASSGIIGIALAFAYYKDWAKQKLYLIAGLFVAVLIHSAFNFFITQNEGANSFGVFGFLWIAAILIMILFEKIRRIETSAMTTGEPEVKTEPPLQK